MKQKVTNFFFWWPVNQESKIKNMDVERFDVNFSFGIESFVLPSRYIPHRALGEGAYGLVISAYDTESKNRLVAIKKVPGVMVDSENGPRIYREIRTMDHLNHPNIVNVCDLFYYSKDIYIVMDYMQSDIYNVMKVKDQTIGLEHIRLIMFQLVKAVYHMHSAKIFHRDLKPSNVLINSNCLVKIADFGLARSFHSLSLESSDAKNKFTEYMVTRWYRAPEIMCGDTYDEKIDMWSLGCILGELVGKRPMFPGTDYLHQVELYIDTFGKPSDEDMANFHNENAIEFIENYHPRSTGSLIQRFPLTSPLVIDLIQKMLMFNPAKRISAIEAYFHPFFNPIRSFDQHPDDSCKTIFQEQNVTLSQLPAKLSVLQKTF